MHTKFLSITLVLALVAIPAFAATTLKTGPKQKKETTTNAGVLVRAGGGTTATLADDGKSLDLKQGIVLTSAPKGGGVGGRPSSNVTTPQTTMKVAGTVIVAYQPEAYLKLTCIEGKVTVRLRALLGEFVTITSGQMLILNPTDKRLPDPVYIDLQKLTQTSPLLTGFAPIPVLSGLDRLIAKQNRSMVSTPLIMTGASPLLEIETAQSGAVDALYEPPQPPPPPKPNKTKVSPPLPPPAPPTLYVIDTPTTFSIKSASTPGYPDIPASVLYGEGNYIILYSAVAPGNLEIRGRPDQPPFGMPYQFGAGATGTTLWTGTFESAGGCGTYTPTYFHVWGDQGLTIDGAHIMLGEYYNPANIFLYSKSGPVVIQNSYVNAGSMLNIGPVYPDPSAYSPTGLTSTVTVTDSSVGGGPLNIEAQNSVDVNNSQLNGHYGSGVANVRVASAGQVTIRNSSQIQAIADAIINGGAVNISDSTVNAGGTTTITGSTVALTNAQISGATAVKVQAMGNGDALIINGGALRATGTGALLRVYAENGNLVFKGGTVNLQGSTVQLVGKQVRVESGTDVHVSSGSNPTDVYSDDHAYNKSGYGNINNPAGVNQHTHGSRPPF